MKQHRIVTALGVLLFLGGAFGLSYLRTRSNQAVVTAPSPPTNAQLPTAGPGTQPTRVGNPVRLQAVPCLRATDLTDPIDIREQPSATSALIGSVTEKDPVLGRLDARAVKGNGDWIRIRYGERFGWVDGALIICRLTPAGAAQLIAGQADQVLGALKARNMRELSQLVHPVKGLRFSPYMDIDPKRSVVLAAVELPAALEARRSHRFGSEDGSGRPISTSFANYYDRFIYDRDFASAPGKRFNEFGAKSTTRPNIWEVYPNGIVVEAHVPGTKPESDGMDWASLLLVFEQHDSRWYLTALVHDQWTM